MVTFSPFKKKENVRFLSKILYTQSIVISETIGTLIW